MFRIAAGSVFLLTLAGAAATAHAAEECGFLPLAEVDQVLAEFAPWHTMVGGAVGHCTFLSDETAPPNSVSFMQQFKASKADADAIFEGMRQGVAEGHATKAVSGLGERAFRYDSKDDGDEGAHMTSIVTQKGRLVVTVSLVLQRPVEDADVVAATRLGQFALRGADDAATALKASTCPWVDAAGLDKLFGGKPHEVQVYGENSCMAADKQSRVLIVSVQEMPNGLSLDAMRDNDCRTRDLPELGQDAKISFACGSGNPRATVLFAAKGHSIDLTWVAAGTEPGEAEKAALVDLAKHARSATAGR